MGRILWGTNAGGRAALVFLLLVPFLLAGCGLDWNLGLWTPPEEEEATPPPADTRIGSASSLSSAWGVAVRSGSVFIGDPTGNKIYKLDQSKAGRTDEKVWAVGTSGTGDLQFDAPAGVALDSAGNVYAADNGNGRVQKLTSSGAFAAAIGVGILTNPVGVAVDSINNLYVSDETLNTVFVFDSAGSLIRQWNGSETAAGIFNSPQGIAVGRRNLQEHLYVVDWGNHQVKVFLTDGTHAFTFGSQGSGNGQFVDPWGVAVDSLGRIYVSDVTVDCVQRFDADGVFQAKLTAPTDSYAPLSDPAGLAVTTSYLYAAENQAKWVRVIDLSDFTAP